ncbi:MAG: hypothetical protein KJ061_03685 [Vicinamibacteraceae bacterium]|nr:hypothetical protein [Vicinamibacteraceae bacterium]
MRRPRYACPAWIRQSATTLALLAVSIAAASAQMPDAGQMSGVPLPTTDLPDGVVSVRVVRGSLANNVVNQVVELHAGHAGGQTLRATTDETGRATFTGVAPGTEVHAYAMVDGQAIQSRDFLVPPSGGIRVVLVAGTAGGGALSAPGETPAGQAPPVSAAPAQPGTVSLGGQTRFIVEMGDEELEVYYLVDIVNGTPAPVETAPLVFEMPAGAQATTVLENSSPQAVADGPRVAVSGPFQPGVTTVQMAFRYPYNGPRVAFGLALPASLTQTSIAVKKVGAMEFHSAQAPNHRDVPLENDVYIMANGPGVAAGQTLNFELVNLPYHSRVPRYTALVLAVLIFGAGAWIAMSGPVGADPASIKRLESRREQLLGEIVRLDDQHAAGRLDAARYQARRRDAVAQLEAVYTELDAAGEAVLVDPAGGPAAEPVAPARVRTAH